MLKDNVMYVSTTDSYFRNSLFKYVVSDPFFYIHLQPLPSLLGSS